MYVKSIGRFALERHVKQRSYLALDGTVPTKSARMYELMKHIVQAYEENDPLTRCAIHYLNPSLFPPDTISDASIRMICLIFKCSRSSLLISENPKGWISGNLKFYHGDNMIDCSNIFYPISIDLVKDCELISSEALLIIVVEKQSFFEVLRKSGFFKQVPCIILTGCGQPDVSTRVFLSRLSTELGLDVVCFMDCNPYGIKIMSVYKYGSKELAHEGYRLTTPCIRWLGLRPTT